MILTLSMAAPQDTDVGTQASAQPYPIKQKIILDFMHTEAMNHLPGMLNHGLTN